MQASKPSNFNLPNALTLLRLLLIPVIIYLFVRDQMMWALGVFIFASLTDIADGYIARKYNLITDFGKLFDPLADKLMVLTVMAALVWKEYAPALAIFILLAKEGLMLLGGLLLLRKNIVVYSHMAGKIAQAVTVLALVLCFFHPEFTRLGVPVHHYILWLGVGLALLTLLYYIKHNGVKLFQKNHAPHEDGKTGGNNAT